MKQDRLSFVVNILALISFVISVPTAGAVIHNIITGEGRLETLWLVAAAVVLVLFLFLLLYYFFNVTSRYTSGVKKFYKNYTREINRQRWSRVKKTYKYAGVTGRCIKVDFINWLSKLPANDNREFKFMLMKPDSSFFRMQVLHKYGFSSGNGDIPAPVKRDIDEEVQSLVENVKSTVRDLKTTAAYKEGRLGIRYYDEYLHHYLEIIDDSQIIVGLLHKGRTGYEDAAVLLNKYNNRLFRRKNISMYDTYMDVWDRLWENGVRAD